MDTGNRLRSGDVAGAELYALTDHGVGVDRDDRVLPISGERVARVMHDRAVVVPSDVIAVIHMLGEVVDRRRDDVRPLNRDEGVAILAALLMPQSDHVPDLVNAITCRAPITKGDRLASTLPADERRTAIARNEFHPVSVCGVRRIAQDEAKRRVRVPVRDGVVHTRGVDEISGDRIRDGCVGPAEL